MRISGQFSGDVVQFKISANKEQDGRAAFIDVEVGVKEAEAEKKFGEVFKTLAFSTMRVAEGVPEVGAGEDGGSERKDDGRSIVFLQDVIKPGQHIVAELHEIVIDENTVNTQPQLLSIRTVKGEARVIAKIRIPVDVSKASLLNAMVKQVGRSVKIRFDPAQRELGFSVKRGEAEDQEAVQ